MYHEYFLLDFDWSIYSVGDVFRCRDFLMFNESMFFKLSLHSEVLLMSYLGSTSYLQNNNDILIFYVLNYHKFHTVLYLYSTPLLSIWGFLFSFYIDFKIYFKQRVKFDGA